MASDFFSIRCGTGFIPKFHNSRMAKKKAVPFYAREWRKFRGLGIEDAAERLGMSAGRLSDLERRNRRFNETHLQRMAEVYGCDPVELLVRDPAEAGSFWAIWERLPPDRREIATDLLSGLARRNNAGG